LGQEAVHDEVNRAVEAATARMATLGATIVRVSIPDLETLTRDLSVMTFEFKVAFNAYLARLGAAAPVKTFDEFMARGQFHPSLKSTFEGDQRMVDGPATAEYQHQLKRRETLRQAVMTLFAAQKIDALLYPHQRRLVVPIGEEQVERNGVLSNSTGFPALTFPGGFSRPTAAAPLGVPIGLELLGPEWSEPTLFRLAYAFEQHGRLRKPPASTPPLR
jgi:amidase